MEGVLPRAWESLLDSSVFVPVIVRSIERFQDSDWSMEPNVHDHFEMVYVKIGEAVFEIEDKSVLIGPNDIIIIKPRQRHRMIVKSGRGCEHIVLSFKFEDRKSGEVSEVSAENFLDFVKGKESGAFIKLKVNQKNEIIYVLNRILKEKANGDIGSNFLNYLFVLELFVLISRALKMEWEENIRERGSKLKELIKVAVNYINNNFERDLALNSVAKYVFLSPSYFARAFKEETGVSPISYLLKVRIENAKELLADTDMKVGEIALSVGFSKQQRFNDIFKKQAGITPTQYRKGNNH